MVLLPYTPKNPVKDPLILNLGRCDERTGDRRKKRNKKSTNRPKIKQLKTGQKKNNKKDESKLNHKKRSKNPTFTAIKIWKRVISVNFVI